MEYGKWGHYSADSFPVDETLELTQVEAISELSDSLNV